MVTVLIKSFYRKSLHLFWTFERLSRCRMWDLRLRERSFSTGTSATWLGSDRSWSGLVLGGWGGVWVTIKTGVGYGSRLGVGWEYSSLTILFPWHLKICVDLLNQGSCHKKFPLHILEESSRLVLFYLTLCVLCDGLFLVRDKTLWRWYVHARMDLRNNCT